jgi:diacylglycerol kinase (ATP)
MRKIIYLVNPISGTSKKQIVRKLIETATKGAGIAYDIHPTTASGNYDHLKDEIKHKGVTDVVMVGGDGTVNSVVYALKDEDVNFGIIPMGSGNGLAYCANIPKNPVRALQVIFNGSPIAIDAFTINDQFSCMLSGLGFDAQVAHDFANSASRGLFTYTQQSLFQFFKAQPYQFQVVLDNFSFYTDAFLICIANSNQFGNNFTIAPQASLRDGLLDIVIVQKMNKARLPFAIMKQVRGNNKLQQLVDDVSKKNILYFQTPSLTIKNLKHAPFHVDGEPREMTEDFNISILPQCFRLLQPN